ncbi:MAG: hypothetical protein K0V04_03885 [Deltaproteobacteria bacterium]|nr:hypothetical protein [Deltaproteobacteria bacterium]
MAIVAMKRVTIVGADADRQTAVATVRAAGVVHVVAGRPPQEPPAALVEERERVLRALEGTASPACPPETTAAEARLALERRQGLLARRAAAVAEATALREECAQARPWGDVDPDDVRWLADHGVRLTLHAPLARGFDVTTLDAADWVGIEQGDGGRLRVTAVHLDPEAAAELPALTLPARSATAIADERTSLEGRQAQLEAALLEAADDVATLHAHAQWLDAQCRTHRVRTGLGERGPLFVLDGYCPADRIDSLRRAVDPHPLVLMVAEPEDDAPVPVALRNGPLARTFEPLVAAFKLPGYRELDPTPLIAPFMGVFFGFCLGDLGYGVVLAIVALLARTRTRQAAVRTMLSWAALLGGWTVVVGALLGNVFGMRLYTLVDIPRDALLFSLADEPKTFFYVSLGFGVVQLSLGMMIRLVVFTKRRRWQAALAALAWLLVIPTLAAGFMGQLAWWPFAAVCGVLLLFAAPEPTLARRLGGGAWALYNVSGLLGNVASYARIFGLGLSSGIIAMVVNTIAATLADGVLGTALAVVLLVAGHTFNFAMAVIGSVVHPARLQLLEFFSTFFEGGGQPYAPFETTSRGDA